ncbi:hypothetical protein M3D92_09110 [Micrococcus terreus]|uniref:hypothetical protein n=1 Tax=Micrococcus TaxID=1269 RepID=UPI0021A8C2FB|nr:hypothetical protein [Micrococcus terreus]MCT2089448.1 hypothetical protein [Micrococcus terreus]
MDVYAVGDWIWVSLENLSSVAPLGTFLAVVVAYSSYRGTIRQKTTADNRSAWWNRVQWAMDAAMDDDDQRRATGMAAIEMMQDSELATPADQAFLSVVAYTVVVDTLTDIAGTPAEDDVMTEAEPLSDNGSDEGGLS